jgi:hypothetical protein
MESLGQFMVLPSITLSEHLNIGSTNVISQITFSSVIALGLMSFIIPSDVTLASTSMISSRTWLNNVDEETERIKGAADLSRDKRGVNLDSNDEPTHDELHIHDEPTNIQHGYGNWTSGPMKTISDSLFSLIILIYVSVIFVFMFFAFCWKEPEPPPPDPAHKNIKMITSMLDEMEKQMEENKRAEEERISVEKEGSIGKECTEMTELKNGIEKSKYDSASSIKQSKTTVTSTKELENNSTAKSRKDAETIVVNVITEKSKSSASVNFKEEQV